MRQTACDVSVYFGSFATGIDAQAAAAVERVIGGDAAVADVTRSRRGIEGEYTICIRTRSAAAAAALFEKLRQGVGEPVRAPVTIIGPHGSHSVPTSP